VNDELERILKETVVSYPDIRLELLRKITKTFVRIDGFLPIFEAGSSEYEAGVLTTRP
jgi:hypothetical protein